MNIRVTIGDPNFRRNIEEAIERLLVVLDSLEADPDIEPGNDDEPSLGWPEARAGSGLSPWATDAGDDRELDLVDDEEGGDAEPSLGAPENHPASAGFLFSDQSKWAQGSNDDQESGNVDDEPFLGWTEDQSQTGAAIAGSEFPIEGHPQFDGTGQAKAKALPSKLPRRRQDWTKADAYKPARRTLGDGRGLKDSDFDRLPWD